MNPFNRQEAIDQFLEICGDPREPMFLPWWYRDTFFNETVQQVLLEYHPHNVDYEDRLDAAWVILAWNTADQLSRGVYLECEEKIAAFLERQDRVWFARLTIAVNTARELANQRREHPETVLEKFQSWRERHYLFETSRVNPIPAPVKYGEAITAVFGAQKFEDSDRPLGAIRKAIHDERKRRHAIMERWAECWWMYLHARETPQSATDLAATMLSKSGVTKADQKK